MKLSVAIATYNEASVLTRCLKSVSDIASEIVIADGGSTDVTRSIAEKFKARVFTFDNPPIFHINKQRAIDRCKEEWILQLDADEEIPPDLKEEIRTVINKKDDNIDGYWLPRKNYFLGRFLAKGGQYPDYTLRLYRKGKGHLPCKSVHEQAVVDGETAYLTKPLLHWADPSFKRYLYRFNRYTDLIAHELETEKLPRNIWSFFLYCLFKPIHWFLLTYVRHKGFMDGWQGFVFSLFSSLRFPVSFMKYLKLS